jgi:protein-L-isoaspartate(D-aspartate) O-methyltransferase
LTSEEQYMPNDDDPIARRGRMVDEQIAARGLRDPKVLAAMLKVAREDFVSAELAEHAYRDSPLPIESDQTISQPFIVAYMAYCLQLHGGDKVLEIGTGSGYAAAVLAAMDTEVYTIERHANLAAIATERLARLGYRTVHVRHGDGTLGWPEHAPYDAILVSAGSPDVPAALKEQLAVGGRLVIPVGATLRGQQLLRLTRRAGGDFEREELLPVAFVPLIGEQGWSEDQAPDHRRPG